MIDEFLLKRFHIRTYNCWDLTREVWLRLTGQDLGLPELTHYTRHEMDDVVEAWTDLRYREIEAPQSPCIVLMLRKGYMPHVGVFYNRRVIHIKRSGAQYQPIEIASLGFDRVRYYLPCIL
jgi:hypothetical protein